MRSLFRRRPKPLLPTTKHSLKAASASARISQALHENDISNGEKWNTARLCAAYNSIMANAPIVADIVVAR